LSAMVAARRFAGDGNVGSDVPDEEDLQELAECVL
jgi:hypothetical protein